MNILRTILPLLIIVAMAACSSAVENAPQINGEDVGRVYITDRTGERWDITQAVSIGFKPGNFQYGLGRDAFTPLDDSSLGEADRSIPSGLRVLGVREGSDARAWSIPKLSGHEIANSYIASKPIAVGF